jgi:hypothetical protein
MKRMHAAIATLAALLACPALAWACPVCFSVKNEATRIAFLGTTVFLTALPLVLMGGVGVWLAKRVEEAERDHAELGGNEPAVSAAPSSQTILTVQSLPVSAATASDR